MGKANKTMAYALASILFWAGGAGAYAGAPTAQVTPGQVLKGKYFGFEPVVAADSKGRVVAAAIDGQTRRILVWTSTDGGKTFALPQATLPPKNAPYNQADPTLQARGGRFFLCMMAQQTARKPGMDAFLLHSADGGKTWTSLNRFLAGNGDVDRPVFAVSPNGRRTAVALIGKSGVMFSSDGGSTWAPAMAPVLPPRTAALPYGLLIDDTGRTIFSYIRGDNPRRLALSVTGDGGKTWRQHDLGRLVDKTVEVPAREESAGVFMMFSGTALARDGAGFVHALSAQRAGKGERVDVWHRRSKDGESWSSPAKLSVSSAKVKVYPAIAAAGSRIHAIWLECAGGWCHVWYRGSIDGGRTWSDPVAVSRPGRATSLMTEKGFRHFSGHYMGVAEDGRGVAHVVWAVSDPDRAKLGEVWHALVRLNGSSAEKPRR